MNPFRLREILPLLQNESVYLVGGSVRDFLLNRRSSDFDFIADGNARPIAEKVASHLGVRVIRMGKGEKSIFRIMAGKNTLDFSSMAGSSIEDDLKARDFTINAIAYDLRQKRFIDVTGGLADLEKKTIRLISKEALLSDPLRMLRAFRLATVLGFSLHRQTLRVIRAHSGLLKLAAYERIQAELFKMMETSDSFPYLEEMCNVGLLQHIIPELKPCIGCTQNVYHVFDVFHHITTAYRKLENILKSYNIICPSYSDPIEDYLNSHRRKVLLKMSILLHDLGKPVCRYKDKGKIRFTGHEKVSGKLALRICTRLKMSNHDTYYVRLIVENHSHPLYLFNAHQEKSLKTKGINRFLNRYQDDIIGLLVHALADQRAKTRDSQLVNSFSRFTEKILKMYFSEVKPKIITPLITGHDLIDEFHLSTSPIIGKILREVRNAYLDKKIGSKNEALLLARELLKQDDNPV
nr:CCA tRNA nucleotidyltransferase [Desulfobacterales bacterium]